MASRPTRLAAGSSLLLGSVVTGTTVDLRPASAVGTTITVDSLADGPSDANRCFDLTAGNCTLRDAITISNYLAGTETITFDPALTGSIVLTSNLEYLTDGVVIEGPGADVLAIDGQGQFSGFAQRPERDPDTNQFPPIDLDLGGLTLTAMSSAAQPHFGAITIITGSLHVHDAVITQSGARRTTGYFGAPISVGLAAYIGNFNLDQTSVILERVTVSDNHGDQGDPNSSSALAGSVIVFAESISMIDCEITDNSSERLAGPVLFGRSVEVRDSLIDGNVALRDFAGLAIVAIESIVTGTVITNNSSSTGSAFVDSGNLGINTTDSHTVLRDTVIAHNHVLYGPTVLLGANRSTLERVTVVDNVSDGVLPPMELNAPTSNYAGGSATVSVIGNATITSSTIADNVGAAIVMSDRNLNTNGSTALNTPSSIGMLGRLLAGPQRRSPSDAPASLPSSIVLAHSTVADNTRGGIIAGAHNAPLTAGQVVLDHTIVAGNGAQTLAPNDVDLPFTSRFSLIGRTEIVPAEGAGNGNVFGADADLQPLQWFSPLIALRPLGLRSAAWNTGDPEFVPPPGTDQRGQPRVIDIIDMGAFEIQQPYLLPRFTG